MGFDVKCTEVVAVLGSGRFSDVLRECIGVLCVMRAMVGVVLTPAEKFGDGLEADCWRGGAPICIKICKLL